MCSHPIFDNPREMLNTKVLFSGLKAAFSLYNTILHWSTLVDRPFICKPWTKADIFRRTMHLRSYYISRAISTTFLLAKPSHVYSKGAYFLGNQLALATWETYLILNTLAVVCGINKCLSRTSPCLELNEKAFLYLYSHLLFCLLAKAYPYALIRQGQIYLGICILFF